MLSLNIGSLLQHCHRRFRNRPQHFKFDLTFSPHSPQFQPLPAGYSSDGLVVQLTAKVEVTSRPTVSRPVCLGVRRPSGTHDLFFFLLEIFFGQLRVCYFVTPSLTRRRVCNLLLLLGLASAVTLGLPSLTRSRVCLLSVSVHSQSVCT
jgi:hypothetical protein